MHYILNCQTNKRTHEQRYQKNRNKYVVKCSEANCVVKTECFFKTAAVIHKVISFETVAQSKLMFSQNDYANNKDSKALVIFNWHKSVTLFMEEV